jgi:hypothetical protein
MFNTPKWVSSAAAWGPAARVKAGHILAYGARLEVELAAPADGALAVRLAFSARCKQGTRR